MLCFNDDKISYLPDFVTEEKIKSGELVFLDVIDVETDIWKQLIYHKNKWVSNSLNALIEYIKKAEFNRWYKCKRILNMKSLVTIKMLL